MARVAECTKPRTVDDRTVVRPVGTKLILGGGAASKASQNGDPGASPREIF